MTSPQSSGDGSLSVAVAIGVSDRFAVERSSVLLRAGLVLRQAAFVELADLAVTTRPQVILVIEDVYAFDPTSFEDLAQKSRAGLAILGSERETDELLMERIERALATSARLRREEEERPTVRAPPPPATLRAPPPKRSSGIRMLVRSADVEKKRSA
jgi:hypothetical protein